MVPSGSGNIGISSEPPVGADNLFESKSTNHISSGNLQIMFNKRFALKQMRTVI